MHKITRVTRKIRCAAGKISFDGLKIGPYAPRTFSQLTMVGGLEEKIHHRGTEDTEFSQRKKHPIPREE